jgi:hypothetical protein
VVAGEIPPEVLDFLSRNIDSIPQLETLLIMSEDPRRQWNEAELAARIYISQPTARAILQSLQRHKLIVASDDRFRFGPVDDATQALVAQVANAYRSNLIPVANFIHNKASASVMEFARAFDLKKDH